MSRFIGSSLALFSFLVSNASEATTLEDIKAQLQSTPYMIEKPADNDNIFAKYCIGNPNSADIPQPNYSDALVIAAAKKLTESKETANARLAEMAQQGFTSSIKEIKEQLQTIIKNSKDKNLVSNAEDLLKEVSQPNIKSVSPAAAASYKAMAQIVLGQLKKEMQGLAPALNSELKGIDVVAFTKLAVDLNKYVKAEVKGVDMKVFAANFAKVYAAIKKNVKPVDYIQAKELAAKVIAWKPVGNESDENLGYAQDVALQLVAVLNKGVPVGNALESVNYYISDVQYYLVQLKAAGFAPTDIEEVVAGFSTENDKVALQSLQKGAEELKALLTDLQNNKDDIAYTAESLVNGIESNIEGGSIKIFDATSEKWAIDFIVQTKSFQSDNILTNAQAVVDYLNQKTSGGNTNAFNTSDSLVYSLEQMSTLSQGLKDTVAAIKLELTKQQTEYILSSVNLANNELQQATELTEDLFYKVSDLEYSLSQGVAVSEETKALITSFNQLIDNSRAVSQIASYMSAVVEEAKQADHFYFYGGVRRLYKLSETLPAEAVKAGANKEAHWFITQLCGEFRDRATMIEAKLKWVQNMNILSKSQEKVIDPATLAQAKNVWMRITARAYYPYIGVAAQVWEARRASQERYIQIGNISDIDNPVAGLTVCETKYVFEKYVAEGKDFDNLETYDKNYESYKTACPTADLTDYYDFRGDSNFKHYSPESNGMIWHATSLARGCTSAIKANKGIYTDDDCKNYFERPFATRYNAARAGLAAWLFRDDKHAGTFSSQGQMVAIYPHKQPALAPFSFGFSETSTDGSLFDYNPNWLGVPNAWNSPDIGFNGFTGMGTDQADQERAYVLIRDAVDRHTDWYSSGYNDGNGTSKNQAYSPFVASSYVMQSSDGFTSCGTTVQCPPDGLKRWMFVFRIKAKNWYTPARIQNNEPIDFDKMWFDETSFGVSGLADSEHAWDRLGTAQEEEFDSILYLVNVEYSDEGDGH